MLFLSRNFSLKLEGYFSSNELEINQCELTYINQIAMEDTSQPIGKWIRIVNIDSFEFENISITTQKRLTRNDEPYGRLICVCNSSFDQRMEPIIDLRLTIRGAPVKTNIEESLLFLQHGRDLIVNSFDEITTEFAHKKWGRK